MIEKDLKKILEEKYLLNIINIEKNKESTVGNVYIIYTQDKKYVVKMYDNLDHTKSMTLLHSDLYNKFNIPKIIHSKNKDLYIKASNSKYIVLYSFLDGIEIGSIDNLNEKLIKQIAIELRRLHDLTKVNKYNLNNIPFNDYNLKRKSLLHFDLTKGNIFYNEEKNNIGFIDFDDAKYGSSICDISILIALLFFSKKRGVDTNNLNLFIDTYYDKDLDLKLQEVKYIKQIAINWINYTLENNEFNPSTKESFEVKKKLIEENLLINKQELIPFKECINKDLYEMYQDIPYEELGSINKLKGISYEEFLNTSKKYIEEETNINKELNTTTIRYILYVNDFPVGEVGIRTTINDFWENKGSQIYYKIRKLQRRKGYGNIILNLGLEKAKKLGFKHIRINCDNKNIASKKVILKNGGKEDIINYKTKDGYSTSYLIDIK